MTNQPPLSLETMITEIREVNTEKGWRSGNNTFREYVFLLHSEIAEIGEAYRDRRLAPYTTPAGKPDDVGSEFADVLIRLLDTIDVFGLIPRVPTWLTLGEVKPEPIPGHIDTFGDVLSWLHGLAAALAPDYPPPSEADFLVVASNATETLLRALVAAVARYSVDLDAEYVRKMAYNRTRPFRHGGRTITDADGIPAAANGGAK